MIGFSHDKLSGSMASRKDARNNRWRMGFFPFLLLSGIAILTMFFWPQPDLSPNTNIYTDNYAPATAGTNSAPAPMVTPMIATPPPQAYDKKLTVHHGDTLSGLLLSANIQSEDVLAILALPLVQHNLVRISPGKIFAIHINKDQELTQLSYQLSPTQTLAVTRQDQGFDAKLIQKQAVSAPTLAAGIISSTLYDAGQDEHLPQKIIFDAAHLFAPKINFNRDLNPGDHFKVIYEASYVGDKAVNTGAILAMQISSQGKTYTLIRHTDREGRTHYYTPDGNSLDPGTLFIRSPVHYTHISSGFSLNRYHPILHFSRPHYGVDFAAPRGTPVLASGDGIVASAGRAGGYGNLLVLNNGHGISTRYGHLNAFAPYIHPGVHVKEGEVVAYVGSTGLATAPHLHYEFRINNIPQNPLSVALPTADPLSGKDRLAFNRELRDYLAEFKATPNEAIAHSTAKNTEQT